MNFQVKNLAIRQYQDRIDSRATEDQAIAAILAAVRLCDFAPTRLQGDVYRVRVPGPAGPPLRRCYLIVGLTGDVIGVQPAHERRGGAVLPEVRDGRTPVRLERELYQRAAQAGEEQAGENRRHPGAKIVGVQRDAPRRRRRR